jgi:hypothetical protein
MSMTFLDVVNRMLRTNGLIRGDTDAIASFSDTAHNSTAQIAQIAVQTELSDLTSRGLLPYQHREQQALTLVTSQRTYAFPSDFVQMWGNPPFFYDPNQNNEIFEYPGGEDSLRRSIYTYRTDPGYPLWFYFILDTVQTVAFYPVPDAQRNGTVFRYDYSASANVLLETDTLPLYTADQQYAFSVCAGRRFKYLFEGKPEADVEKDANYRSSRSTLFALLGKKQPARRYGFAYVSGSNWDRF